MKRLIFLLCACLAGCAELTAVRVTDENPTPSGLPLYGTKPILIVTGQSAKIEFIPNLNERYALQLRTFIAKNDTTLTFNPNGTLSKSETNFDTTAAIPLLEKAFDKFLPVQPTASGSLEADGTSQVRVFDFVFHPDGSLSLKEIGPGVFVSNFTPKTPAPASKGATQKGDKPGTGSLQPVEDQ